jgi:hypothetical protein
MNNGMQNKKEVSITGLIYVVVAVTGIFTLAYMPPNLFVADNSSATYNNIIADNDYFVVVLLALILCTLNDKLKSYLSLTYNFKNLIKWYLNI